MPEGIPTGVNPENSNIETSSHVDEISTDNLVTAEVAESKTCTMASDQFAKWEADKQTKWRYRFLESDSEEYKATYYENRSLCIKACSIIDEIETLQSESADSNAHYQELISEMLAMKDQIFKADDRNDYGGARIVRRSLMYSSEARLRVLGSDLFVRGVETNSRVIADFLGNNLYDQLATPDTDINDQTILIFKDYLENRYKHYNDHNPKEKDNDSYHSHWECEMAAEALKTTQENTEHSEVVKEFAKYFWNLFNTVYRPHIAGLLYSAIPAGLRARRVLDSLDSESKDVKSVAEELTDREAKQLLKDWTMSCDGAGDQKHQKFMVEQFTEKNMQILFGLEEEYPGASGMLLREFGLTDYARYSDEMLIAQIKERNNLNIPYILIVFPKVDYSAAFYQDKDILHKLYKEVESHGYTIRTIEGEEKTDLARRIGRLDRKYNRDGKGRTPEAAIVGGHGTESTIQFGAKHLWNEEDKVRGILSQSDITNNSRIEPYRRFFEGCKTIILVSCSTGKENGIGQEMSYLLGPNTEVIAPIKPTSIKVIDVKFDPETGKLASLDAEYWDTKDAASFQAGEPIE